MFTDFHTKMQIFFQPFLIYVSVYVKVFKKLIYQLSVPSETYVASAFCYEQANGRIIQVDKQTAENTIAQYLKPVFGFALKRCRTIEDAQDLSQEILFKAFRALCIKDDINDISKFIWTVAHNALNNYYRDNAKNIVGVSVDEVAELIASPNAVYDLNDETDVIKNLQSEIAYLSKIQRKIVIAYYFENRKQVDIAKSLGISLGTVKWHLFESKKELKRGINKMKKSSELKFNPVKFEAYGLSGSIGTKSLDEFFRSALSQNICYCVRNNAKTINEIAGDLGVSPVYVESEVEFLEEYGFLLYEKKKYIVNFVIDEPSPKLLAIQNYMYTRAAGLFANDLYDELISTGILDNPDIVCGQTDEPVSFANSPRADYNFILWSLIPYIAARSGSDLTKQHISFEEVATYRPDGGHNICHASVAADETRLPKEWVHMKNWIGPMWNGRDDGQYMWQIDSEYSDRPGIKERNVQEEQRRVLSLFNEEKEHLLSKHDYAYLAELGYIKTNGDYDGHFKSAWQIVILNGKEIRDKLLAIGTHIKEKHWAEFEALKIPFVKAMLEEIPPHLRKVREHELQYVFHSDGWFLLHCVTVLLKNGKLHEPAKGQRKALSTIIAKN